MAFTIREPLRRNLMLGAEGKPVQTSFREALPKWAEMAIDARDFCGDDFSVLLHIRNHLVGPGLLPADSRMSAAETGKALAVIMIFFACPGMYLGAY